LGHNRPDCFRRANSGRGRYDRLDEIAHAVAALASGEVSDITGHDLAVDGGFTTAGILI
jgi:NAD(P)-dependent dehydrogenase (short-subunit alcohol dehydrogenase family)